MSKKKNYTRREFLKASGRATAGGIVYGFIGNLLGKTVQYGKDFYEGEIEPSIDSIKKVSDKISRIEQKASKYNPLKLFEKDKQRNSLSKKEVSKSKEEISRRDFFDKIFSHFYQNPIVNATTTGVVGGSGKSVYNTFVKKRHNIKIAKLRDKNQELEERLENVENKYRENKTLTIIGFLGIIISFVLGPLGLTGFSILGNNYPQSISISIIVFVASLLIIFLGYGKKHKRNLP